jgi:hypothetical protein
VTAFLVVLPLALIAGAFVASFVFVRLSTLRITGAGVEIRNYPQATRFVALEQVDRFVETQRSGNFSFVRPGTAALLLVDGTRVPVRCVADPEAGWGVEALNDRVEVLRHRN